MGIGIDSTLVKPSIVNYNYSKNFTLVHQRPNIEVIRSTIYHKLCGSVNPDGKHDTECMLYADSLFKQNNEYKKMFTHPFNYWVINMRQNIVFGPLQAQEFNRTCDSLGVKMNYFNFVTQP